MEENKNEEPVKVVSAIIALILFGMGMYYLLF